MSQESNRQDIQYNSIASVNKDNSNSRLIAHTIKAPMSRRNFLGLSALGIGSIGVMTSMPHRAMALTTNTELPTENATACLTPTIATRLFASSNTGFNEVRNKISLERMTCAGFKVENPEVIRRQYLRFSGTDQQRVSDLQNIATGGIKAPKLLLAVRGGYGAMRMLEHINWESLGQLMQEQGTVLAGFSDITALQCALLAKGGMSSLSAPMLYSEFGKPEPDKVSCQGFVNALTDPNLIIELPQQAVADGATAITGTMWGGNLSVVSALAGSDYLPEPKGGIVFLEDVGEQPYRIERMLYTLYLSGAFKQQQAIVLGAFSRMGEDSYDKRYDLGEVIEHLQRLTKLPIYTGLPFGHVANKQSFPLGTTCKLTPSANGIKLEFMGYPTIDKDLIHVEGLWS